MAVRSTRVAWRSLLGLAWSLVLAAGSFVLAQTGEPSAPCVITGRVTNAGTPLPGVSLVAARDGQVVAATSTDSAGLYRLRIAPGEYRLTAELAAFSAVEQALALTNGRCPGSLDLALVLASRAPGVTTEPVGSPEPSVAGTATRGGRGGRRGGGPAPQGAQPTVAPRFAPLELLQAEAGDAAPGTEAIDEADPALRLLPPGFSTDAATSVVAVTGDAASLDRGQLRDRLDALGRGEFAAAGAELPAGFGGGPDGGQPGGPFGGGFAQGGFGGGRGGGGRGGGGAGRGGGFLGRGRAQNPVQGSATYTFGGSVLDAAPYPLRANAQNDPGYTRQQFGATVGGPLRIPGVYDGSRSTFFVNYSGGRSTNLIDQYATVPTAAMRAGDLSELGALPIDPATGQPFPGGRLPVDRLDPGAVSLLQYYPLPNLPGTTQNYRRSDTTLSTSNNVSLRLTHRFTGAVGGRSGRGGRGGGFPGRGGGRAGTAVVMNAQVQYRQSDADATNVFPALGGVSTNATLSVPVTLNVLRGRTVHNIQVTATRTSSAARNRFANVTNVAGIAGISGVATDPSEWGVPSLSFTSVSGLQDLSPTTRADRRLQIQYSSTRPSQRHGIRWGGDVRLDTSSSRSNRDARGAFVFTGLYSAAGPAVRGQGLDIADFLLGLPQQASVQYADEVVLKGQAVSLFVQDDWRVRGNLTLNVGARYELVRPYTEASGRMVNLDVAPGFTGAAPVLSGGTGLFTGSFPRALVNEDLNNVAPRVGLAWRLAPGTVVRTGYGVSFNNGSYATIARQLVAQPPFAVTSTSIGSLEAPLSLADPFASVDASTTTNNFGIDKDYQLGVIQTWNVDLDRSVGGGWQVGGGYTGTRGSTLDLVRAPNRDPEGLRIEGVQPFLWQASEGRSTLHAATIRARRRQTRGIAGNASYTFARSMDDAASIGGGGQVVAQDDQNLAAEWGRSSFDRRHQFSGNLTFELPFGPNRPWLYQGGPWAALLSDWSLSVSVTAQSGTPFTARLVGAASDVARGTNGTLRADYTGASIGINDPSLLAFFNTAAFAVPAAGTFGSAGRNTIVGPAMQQVDASVSRDVRLGGNQVVSIRLQGTNLFNAVRWGSIDTVVNSPTFGQVVSIRPMRSVQLNVRMRF